MCKLFIEFINPATKFNHLAAHAYSSYLSSDGLSNNSNDMRIGSVLFAQFTAKLKEVRIILDPTCKASKGARLLNIFYY